MDPFLKQAYEAGQRAAAEELAQRLRDAVKKREALVGWKEQSMTPTRLSDTHK